MVYNECIDREGHYYISMHPSKTLKTPEGSIDYITSSSPEKWVECVILIDEIERKVTLCPVEMGYNELDVSMDDFICYIKSGHVVHEKTFPSLIGDAQNPERCYSAYTLRIH